MVNPKIRVALADRHPVTRAGIHAILASEADMEVVGEAEDGYKVQRLCEEQSPDVLLSDLNLAGP